MLPVACQACHIPLPLDAVSCPACGLALPTQAWLHLATALRYERSGRLLRAQWELLAAQRLAPGLEGLEPILQRVASRLAAADGDPALRPDTRFVTAANQRIDVLPWGPHDWLARPDIVAAEDLLLVRVHMPPGMAHEFHRHPEMEEIIYVLEGRAEQWVDRERRLLGPGESAHIPADMVHGTYNAGEQTLRFLAILGPARIDGPPLIDMSQEEPWRSLRARP